MTGKKKIKINNTCNADGRTATDLNSETLLESTNEHRRNVRDGMDYIAELIHERGLKHDYTKIGDYFPLFNDTVMQGLSNDEFEKSEWKQLHLHQERHHLNGNVPIDVNLIDVIENSKTPVIGIAFSVAASAASSILIACKERYGFKHSVVLIHDGSVFVGNSGNKAKQTMAFLDRVDEINKELILARTKITEEEFEANKEKEQYMFANEAKEKGIIDGIIGIDIDLDDIL